MKLKNQNMRCSKSIAQREIYSYKCRYWRKKDAKSVNETYTSRNLIKNSKLNPKLEAKQNNED